VESGRSSMPITELIAATMALAPLITVAGAPAMRITNVALGAGCASCAIGKNAIGRKSSRSSRYLVFATTPTI
jgi:hypothetical protein